MENWQLVMYYLSSSWLVMSMLITPTTTEEIDKIIKYLNDSNPGYDDVHIKVLQLAFNVISLTLSKLMNSSIQQGVFPDS